MGIQDAINAARIHNYCVSTSDDTSALKNYGAPAEWTYKTHKVMYIETAGAGVVDTLTAKNYFCAQYDKINLFFGGVQGITFQYDANGNFVSVTGGADPRRDGKALAY